MATVALRVATTGFKVYKNSKTPRQAAGSAGGHAKDGIEALVSRGRQAAEWYQNNPRAQEAVHNATSRAKSGAQTAFQAGQQAAQTFQNSESFQSLHGQAKDRLQSFGRPGVSQSGAVPVAGQVGSYNQSMPMSFGQDSDAATLVDEPLYDGDEPRIGGWKEAIHALLIVLLLAGTLACQAYGIVNRNVDFVSGTLTISNKIDDVVGDVTSIAAGIATTAEKIATGVATTAEQIATNAATQVVDGATKVADVTKVAGIFGRGPEPTAAPVATSMSTPKPEHNVNAKRHMSYIAQRGLRLVPRAADEYTFNASWVGVDDANWPATVSNLFDMLETTLGFALRMLYASTALNIILLLWRLPVIALFARSGSVISRQRWIFGRLAYKIQSMLHVVSGAMLLCGIAIACIVAYACKEAPFDTGSTIPFVTAKLTTSTDQQKDLVPFVGATALMGCILLLDFVCSFCDFPKFGRGDVNGEDDQMACPACHRPFDKGQGQMV